VGWRAILKHQTLLKIQPDPLQQAIKRSSLPDGDIQLGLAGGMVSRLREIKLEQCMDLAEQVIGNQPVVSDNRFWWGQLVES